MFVCVFFVWRAFRFGGHDVIYRIVLLPLIFKSSNFSLVFPTHSHFSLGLFLVVMRCIDHDVSSKCSNHVINSYLVFFLIRFSTQMTQFCFLQNREV